MSQLDELLSLSLGRTTSPGDEPPGPEAADPLSRFVEDSQIGGAFGGNPAAAHQHVHNFHAETADTDATLRAHYQQLARAAGDVLTPSAVLTKRDGWDELVGDSGDVLAKSAVASRKRQAMEEYLRDLLSKGESRESILAHARRGAAQTGDSSAADLIEEVLGTLTKAATSQRATADDAADEKDGIVAALRAGVAASLLISAALGDGDAERAHRISVIARELAAA